MLNAARSPRTIPQMTPTAIPTLEAVFNPEPPFDCDCVCSGDCAPPLLSVLLSGTVILQAHYRLPRDDEPPLHSHESINVHIRFEWVTDSNLVFRGCVKASVRVHHKLGHRHIADSQAHCLGLTVECDLEFVYVGYWQPIRNEVNGYAVEFERRRRCITSGVARGEIKSIGYTLRDP